VKTALAAPSINGLADQEAVRHLAAEGYNELLSAKPRPARADAPGFVFVMGITWRRNARRAPGTLRDLSNPQVLVIRASQRKAHSDLCATNPRYVAHRTDQLECGG
jgi:hypothetical protein